jgi:hypothetical protein
MLRAAAALWAIYALGGPGGVTDTVGPALAVMAGGVCPSRNNNVHGNSAKSPYTAYLYRLEDQNGNLLKWGITQDLGSRYPASYMSDKNISEFARGRRADMLLLERNLIETNPGPLNRERWRGRRLGQ